MKQLLDEALFIPEVTVCPSPPDTRWSLDWRNAGHGSTLILISNPVPGLQDSSQLPLLPWLGQTFDSISLPWPPLPGKAIKLFFPTSPNLCFGDLIWCWGTEAGFVFNIPSCDIYIYIFFFIHLSLHGHLGCFHILAIVNNGAMNIGVNTFFKLVFLFSSGKYPNVKFLDFMTV